jgi:hypothetical protein
MSTPNVQSIVSKSTNAGDLAPLVANDNFRKAADAELVLLDDAATKAQALAAKNEDLQGVVAMFSAAIGSLRAIAKRFPEANVPVAEAIKQVQLAMGLVKDNPAPETAKTAAGTTPKPLGTPTPAPATPVAPQP